MLFQHVYDKSLAQASYFVGCQKKGVAAVIDPKRDVDTYIDIANQNNMRITHIFESHIHADFLSGSRELALLSGADLYLSDEGGPDWQYEFAHQGLKDGDEIKMGNLVFNIIHTPGHTPESISILLTDTPASEEPVILFTGDFVFVGDVGRPDLLEKAAGIKGTQDIGALQMFDSIKKFDALPDYIQVWPGHGAGSACGKALGAVPSTTVGYEKIRNWALQHKENQKGFVDYLLSDQPEPPKYFAMMKKLNKIDRPLLTQVPSPKRLTAKELNQAKSDGVKIIDARNKVDFAEGYFPGSINIQGNNAFATWAGWFIEYDEPFIVIASESQLDDLSRKLMRIGLDNMVGYFPAQQLHVDFEGKLDKVDLIDFEEFKQATHESENQIVDLRGVSEYNSGHVLGADNVFVGTLPSNLDKISKDKKVIIHCQGGDRASIAYSILTANGFKNVVNYSPGMNEWISKGENVISQ